MTGTTSHQSELCRLFDAVSIGVMQQDAQGVITCCNTIAASMLGAVKEQIEGTVFPPAGLKIIHKDGNDFLPGDFPSLVTVNTGKSLQNVIMGLKKPEGDLSWIGVSSHIAAGLDEHAPRTTVITLTDITEIISTHHMLSENEKRFRSIFNSAYQFIGLLSTDGIVIEANDAALNFARLAPGDVKGKYFWECYPGFTPDNIGWLKEDIRNAGEGKFVRYTTPLSAPDRSLRWIDFSLKPVFDKNKQVSLLIAEGRDVTETVELQKKYRKEQDDVQKEVLKAVIDAQEKERNEIGKELHDNINQMLASVKLLLENYRQTHDSKDNVLARSVSIVEECIEEIRQLTGSLVSPKMQKIGFSEAVKQLLENLVAVRNYEVRLALDDRIVAKLTDQQALAVYRIIQEQLNNIVKHAGAKRIAISLSSDDGKARLEITDDGRGFDIHAKTKGIGLFNMENRVHLLNGLFDVIAETGKGCSIIAYFPLAKV